MRSTRIGEEDDPLSDQKSEPFETPERSKIPGITQGHVAAMEASDGEPEGVWVSFNMSHLLLRTIGRRSGRAHKVALPYWLDEAQRPVVVGSYAGAEKHPAWFLNLTDRGANPEIYVKQRYDAYWAEAVVLEGEERQDVWDRMIPDRPYYADYQSMTERELPLIRIEKRRPAPTPPSDD